MNQAFAKAQIEANITSRFGPIFKIGEKPPADFLSSGLFEVDALTGGGLPRGAITEIVGSMSSGRMSLLVASLAYATTNSETCVVVDTSESFDPQSAANARVDFNRLLWVRCGNNVERAFKATDLLLQSGSFGFIALNLAEVTANNARRIISSWWFRFRRAIENTPTAFVVISPVACVRSCATVILETRKSNESWSAANSAVRTNDIARPRVINGHRISLVESSQNLCATTNHSHLLWKIDVQVKLAKPTTLTATSVQFRQPHAVP